IIKHRIMEPYYTFDEHAGMDPANSISVTPHVDVTSFFPQDNTTTSYIYFVKSETAFSPHEHQKKAKPSHLFAEEHAIKDIPPGDVIAAVKISRYFIDEANGRYHNSHYHLDGDILWNPLLNGQKSPELEMFREKITYIVEIRKGKYIKIPAKGNQTPLDITQFETITESAHKEIDRYNQLYMLIKNFVFYRVADKEAYTKKIIEIAGQLDDARATMPGTNKTLLEYVKFYGRFIEEPEVNPYYDEVVKAIEELVSKAYRNQNK
ncbi:MAG: hypothetical protein JSS53_10420, partial [Proteobacteria bacterium]|nr:hypothetical protein [Pseudomonadota bacterium]